MREKHWEKVFYGSVCVKCVFCVCERGRKRVIRKVECERDRERESVCEREREREKENDGGWRMRKSVCACKYV